jgi:signal peptidase
MSGRRRAPRTRGALYFLGAGLSGGLLALTILLGLVVVGIPAVTGAQPLTVLTSSMEPRFPPGTLVIIRPVEEQAIMVGDIITYQIESGKPGVVTHRVVGLTTGGDGSHVFTTKGDNNDAADPKLVRPVQVQGRLWYSVPWIGYVSTFVNGEHNGWLVPSLVAALFVYAGYMIASAVVSAARTRRSNAR